MTDARVSTVLVGTAVVVLVASLALLQRIPSRPDTPVAAILFFTILPITAFAGFVCSIVLLVRDHRALRWVELLVSAALIIFIVMER